MVLNFRKNLFYIITFIVNIFYIIQNFIQLLNIKFWRHDAAFYFTNYLGKLKEEGRWINYFLFNFIREIPPLLSISIHLICLGYFIYKIAFNITKDNKLSIIFSMIVINIPGLYSQILWPVTSLPAYLFLGVLPHLSTKFSKNKIFLLSGVFFFGTFSNYYFLVPLLYLDEFYSKEVSWENCIYLIKKIVFPWIGCFLIGYIFSNLITYILANQFIVLAKWRKATPIDSFKQFILNYNKISNSFYRDLKRIIQSIGNITAIIIIITNIFSIKKNKIYYLFICVLSILGIYATTLYHGIHISERTSFIIWIGLLFMFLLNNNDIFNKKYKMNFMFCFIVSLAFARSTYKNLKWYSSLTQIYSKELEVGEIELTPYRYNKVIILADNKQISKLNNIICERNNLIPFGGLEGLDQVVRTLIPLLKSKGFNKIEVQYPKNTIENRKNQIFIKSVDEDSNLIIEINNNFLN